LHLLGCRDRRLDRIVMRVVVHLIVVCRHRRRRHGRTRAAAAARRCRRPSPMLAGIGA